MMRNIGHDVDVYIVYIDETGDPGKPGGGASPEYGLGVVVVEATKWKAAHDGLLEMRRSLKRGLAIPISAEIKASYLVRNEGWFKGGKLSSGQRKYIYRKHLQAIEKLGLKSFSVVVDKKAIAAKGNNSDVRSMVWETLFQRLVKTYPGQPMLLVHDEGEEATIRKYARRARRYLTAGNAASPGSSRVDFQLLLDDPVSRRSHESLFTQQADLVAYAAIKAIREGGSRARRICPETMWSELGSACQTEVNRWAITNGSNKVPGVVVRAK